MRTLLLIIAAIVVAASGFAVYLWLQDPGGNSNVGRVDPGLTPSTMPATQTFSGIGQGEGVWFKQYDNDGQLVSTFRAARYIPRDNGVVDVIEPTVEYNLGGGRRMVMGGDRGIIRVEQRAAEGKRTVVASSGAAAPTSGQLLGVKMQLFETGDEPTLTLSTNNVSFDSQTFKFVSESFVDSYGVTVASDQVPVVIRGQDIDFDGRGLIVRYDDLNKRLALLQIAHGDRVVIKRPELLSQASKKQPLRDAATLKPAPETTRAETTRPVTEKSGIETTKPTASPWVTRPGTTAPSSAAPLYRLTMSDEVRITQGDKPLTEADEIAIEFRPGQSIARNIARAPSTTPATKPAAAPVTLPTTSVAVTQPATQSTTQPATQPVEPPIVLKWKGVLRLTAIDKPTVPLLPGEAAMLVRGSPLIVHQPQGVLQAGRLQYETAGDRITIEAGDGVEQVSFVDADGRIAIASPRMEFSDLDKQATLIGPSQLRVKQPAKSTTQPATELLASWNDRCTVRFSQSGQIEAVAVRGGVGISHPQLKMSSQTLNFDFTPVGEKWLLHEITAAGEVKCDLSDPQNPNRLMQAERLGVVVDSRSGEVVVRGVQATGKVLASNGDQTLSADNVGAIFDPRPATRPASTQPTVDLSTFVAKGNVRVNSPDALAVADLLTVQRENQQNTIELRGQPAELTQAGRTLRGPIVVAEPERGVARIDGAGTLRALDSGRGSTTRPIDVSWKGGVSIDAAKNTVIARENVLLRTTDPDGTVTSAAGQELTIALRAAPPATRPTTKPAPDNPFQGKSLASITLAGGVRVESVLNDSAGALVKRNTLLTERIVANIDEAQQLSTFEIPVAGNVVIEDYRDAKRSTTRPADKMIGGVIVIAWNKSLRFDQKPDPLLTLTGEVKIAHRESNSQVNTIDVSASRVRVAMHPPAATTRPAKPATRPAARPAGFALGVRFISADAPVVLKSRDLTLSGQTLQFNPADHMVLLSGNDRSPVTWTESTGSARGEFQELWYNVETGLVDRWTNLRATGRQ